MEQADDSVFDENTDLSQLEGRDYARQSERLRKEGYIEGRLSSEQKHSQEYFDEGFSRGYRTCFPLSSCRGRLSAKCFLVKQAVQQRAACDQRDHQQVFQQAERLIDSIKQQEKQLVVTGRTSDCEQFTESLPAKVDAMMDSLDQLLDS